MARRGIESGILVNGCLVKRFNHLSHGYTVTCIHIHIESYPNETVSQKTHHNE